MHRYQLLLLCLFLACPLWAEEKQKPALLTPKEIEDGWILLFDGETTFGWMAPATVRVEDGIMVVGGKEDSAIVTTNGFTELSHFCECRTEGDKKVRLELRSGGAAHQEPPPRGKGVEKHLEGHIRQKFEFREPTWPARGQGIRGGGNWSPDNVRLAFFVPADNKLFLRNVKVKPGGLKPLFNGNDLTGWKEHPGKKSKFSVSPEGWLHIKDGPGDLQTEALYDDFILQLECKTNGKYLNSGVFFRCRPGEYQQGYEAQIHNGFDPDKPKEYIVEEYDPETYELKEKKKVQSPAIDYGTGAIYRRVPARKQAAKDGEWFTITIIAHGRHIATWVNGIQMVDWTDNRPPKDNARNGCRLEKGAISLQGHDPTTDLYFRNIRIAELPKK